ncbi:MAG: serine/threonine protein kinase [Planctomycetia bacterium]|nr:serine/threonine protein kinase [Planctomycetia bacterium]
MARVGWGRRAGVYLARPEHSPPTLPPSYVVKLLLDETDAWSIEALRREAEVGRSVSHAHLVPVLSAHLDKPPYYLVMPRLSGRTLTVHVAKRRISTAMALCYARQIAEALAALDESGWTHGDVKPDNVVVSPEGHATLIDLEFARRRGQGQARQPAGEPALLGTALYMAPELAVGALAAGESTARADIQSDLYSLGIMLYEMLAGQRPFTGRTLPEVLRQQREGRAPSLRARCPWLPCELALLVRQLLAKDPLRRPQTAREVVRRLMALEMELLADR